MYSIAIQTQCMYCTFDGQHPGARVARAGVACCFQPPLPVRYTLHAYGVYYREGRYRSSHSSLLSGLSLCKGDGSKKKEENGKRKSDQAGLLPILNIWAIIVGG